MSLGVTALVVGITAGALSIGVQAASLAGAFDPKKPDTDALNKAAIDAQIEADRKALTRVQTEIENLKSQSSSSSLPTYVALGFGVLAVGGGAYLLFRKK